VSIRLLRPLHRVVAVVVAAAFLSTGSSMAMLLANAPAAGETSHRGSHGSLPEHQPPGHHETDCCSYCTVDCASHFGPVAAKVASAPVRIIESDVGFVRGSAPAIPRGRYLHPPSQAPPALFG
jgi:anaerobic selenocysteine-containing dehydrogenase